MKLEDLMTLRRWTPLVDVIGIPVPEAFLGAYLYRIQTGLYFQLSQFKGNNLAPDGAAPFLTGLYLFPDDGAAMRVTKLAIEDDFGMPLLLPPALLPEGSLPEYGSLLSGLRRMQPRVCQETASYRIAVDGKFIHRTIETEQYTFYFRGAADDDREPPFAVLYKLM